MGDGRGGGGGGGGGKLEDMSQREVHPAGVSGVGNLSLMVALSSPRRPDWLAIFTRMRTT